MNDSIYYTHVNKSTSINTMIESENGKMNFNGGIELEDMDQFSDVDSS